MLNFIELDQMKSKIPKKCEICQDTFYPDQRVEKRQKVCDKLACKLEKKRRSQQKWLDKNQGYFKGRYPQLKDQILENKGKKSQSKTRPSPSIQDELTPFNNNLLTLLLSIRSIQDEITYKITKSKLHLENSLKLLYKSN